MIRPAPLPKTETGLSASAPPAQRSAERPAPGSLAAWVLACRPQTLIVGVVPVLLGAALAHQAGAVRGLAVLAALLGAVFIQIGTNLANDVFDYEKGADTEARLGPLRVTQAGLLTPRAMRAGMWLSFGLAMLCGVYLTAVAGPAVVAIGLVSIASGLAYTAGPYPLGYNGLGDVFVFVFFGPVAVCGTVFVSAGAAPALASLPILASLPVGALAAAVLVVNNVRDHRTDVVAGKRTLVVRLGRRFGVGLYFALIGLAYVVPVLLVLTARLSFFGLLPLLSAPLSLPLLRVVAVAHDGDRLNRTLAKTAQLLLVFGLLWVLAIGLS
ncbi:MAG TPA: 1,4-dihydroxy-2-naphthoate polyprenyltransferase [Pseudomonadota bacterium]|nr:1,4-dihydroxy-2-naphthoate polyprenyltransferase [Pseudomonadota bacterium]